VVELTGAGSNKYDALIRFKKSVPAMVSEAGVKENPAAEFRKTNEYGEIAASMVKQEQKRLSEDEISLLISAYLSGMSTYALAEQFGCHRTTVSDVLKRHGVTVS
jgi:DNA-directed RNA polymerase specialized sigma24 family protein